MSNLFNFSHCIPSCSFNFFFLFHQSHFTSRFQDSSLISFSYGIRPINSIYCCYCVILFVYEVCAINWHLWKLSQTFPEQVFSMNMCVWTSFVQDGYRHFFMFPNICGNGPKIIITRDKTMVLYYDLQKGKCRLINEKGDGDNILIISS